MKIIDRNQEQSLMIGPDVEVKVLGYFWSWHHGELVRNVKLGIKAPRSVPIMRDNAKDKVGRR